MFIRSQLRRSDLVFHRISIVQTLGSLASYEAQHTGCKSIGSCPKYHAVVQTHIVDMARKALKLKWDCTSHVCHMPSVLWVKITTGWNPTGRRGSTRCRWRDDFDSFLEDWPDATQDRGTQQAYNNK